MVAVTFPFWQRLRGQSGREPVGPEPAADLTEVQQSLSLLVPDVQGHAFKAMPQRQGIGQLQFLDGLVAAFEIVVWNAWAQVVNVVETDVAREPLQNARQLVVRASLHGGLDVVPFLGMFP